VPCVQNTILGIVMVIKCCQQCGEEPIQFKDYSGDDAWYIFKWKEDTSLYHLMSDGSMCLGVCLERYPMADDRMEYLCVGCASVIHAKEEGEELDV
jgi:hypothetical protein